MEKIRTDLAAELYGEAEKAYASENKGKPDGIIETEKNAGDGVTVSEIEIENEVGAALIGKPVGKYVTVSFPTARDMDFSSLEKTANVIAEEIKLLIGLLPEKPKSLLFCGLGNRLLSVDAVGPLAFDRVIATRHIKTSNPAVFEGASLFDVCSVSPGVAAQTGIEACEIIKAVAAAEKPDLIIVADALAAKSRERLARTVQISTTGISPGSGIGGAHKEISLATVGIPVFSVGTPTVIASSVLAGDEGEKGDIFFVSPKEIDVISKNLGTLIGCAVNRAFQENLSYKEMLFL